MLGITDLSIVFAVFIILIFKLPITLNDKFHFGHGINVKKKNKIFINNEKKYDFNESINII